MFTPGAWDRVVSDIRFDPEEMARRVGIQYPDARILVVIRDQADWLGSAYRYFLPRLPERQRSFEDFCLTPRGHIYREAAHYDRTIHAYGERFGLSNLCVLRFELLRMSPETFLARTSEFLGVDLVTLPSGVVNPSSSPAVSRIRRRLPYLDRLPGPVKKLLRRAADAVPTMNSPILSADVRASIAASYAESNRRTEDLLVQIEHEGGLSAVRSD